MVGLSEGEKEFIKGGIAQDLRSDGRRRYTYRPICVETGVIAQVTISRIYMYGFISFENYCWLI